MPPLYGEHRAAPAPVPWNTIGLGLRLLFYLPFLLGGLSVLAGASSAWDIVGGLLFVGVALVLAYREVRRALARRQVTNLKL
jgi:hypothetical protein